MLLLLQGHVFCHYNCTRLHLVIIYITITGPHSVAKCSVIPEGSYRYKVTYVPVETGVYSIFVKWYNQEIDGKLLAACITYI